MFWKKNKYKQKYTTIVIGMNPYRISLKDLDRLTKKGVLIQLDNNARVSHLQMSRHIELLEKELRALIRSNLTRDLKELRPKIY